jgi:predicted nucleic acid-binding protein
VIVPDASAILEILLRTAGSAAIEARVLDEGESLHAPYLLDVEVAQVLRRFVAQGELTAYRGSAALALLAAFPLARYPHEPLLGRVWALRKNLTAYDATYVALAEGLGATLLTCDRRLAAAPGHHARIELC